MRLIMQIVLPARLQAPHVEELLVQLRDAKLTEDVEVDGTAVTHVDFAGVQLLLSLLKTREGVRISSSGPLDAAFDLLSLGGLRGANSGNR
jgi:anti-anti-sigma regulatory factor